MKKYDLAVVIGRFQPFHNGHQLLVLHALRTARHVLILIGSSQDRESEKNPFMVDMRMNMISESLPRSDQRWVVMKPIADDANDATWALNVKALARAHCPDDRKITLVGCDRDESTFYLKLFPEWKYTAAPESATCSGTEIRKMLFSKLYGTDDIEGFVPNGVFELLAPFFRLRGPGMTRSYSDKGYNDT